MSLMGGGEVEEGRKRRGGEEEKGRCRRGGGGEESRRGSEVEERGR